MGEENRTLLAVLGMEDCNLHNRNNDWFGNQPTLTRDTHLMTSGVVPPRLPPVNAFWLDSGARKEYGNREKG